MKNEEFRGAMNENAVQVFDRQDSDELISPLTAICKTGTIKK